MRLPVWRLVFCFHAWRGASAILHRAAAEQGRRVAVGGEARSKNASAAGAAASPLRHKDIPGSDGLEAPPYLPSVMPLILPGGYNCVAYPLLCKEPFNCHEGTMFDQYPVAQFGRPNLKVWCQIPVIATTMIAGCVTKLPQISMLDSALKHFDIAVGYHMDEVEGSHCFLEGHCTNELVNDNTTTKEAEGMCDRRFTPFGWRGNFFPEDFSNAYESGKGYMARGKFPIDAMTGFNDQRAARIFTKMSCATGVFQCMVQHCKHTFCRNKYYINKYAKLLPRVPGHQIIDWI